jgi:hypothetical protein
MLGTRLDGCAGHLIRNSFSKCLLAENHFGHTAVTAIKLNGRELPDPLHHQCVIGNVFATNTGGWVFEMGPQNDTVAEYLTDVLIEGNTFRPITEPSFVVVVFSVRTALRNNIFDIGASTACHFARRGIGPTPVGCSFDHNTVVRRNGSPMWTLNAQTGDITPVRNNIWHCTQGQVLARSGTINEIGSFTGNPLFTNPANLDFSLQLGSPAIDAAVGTHVRVDFNRAPRSPGSLDVGALERQ